MNKLKYSAVGLIAMTLSSAVIADQDVRIISAGSTSTEIIYALGIEERLVGVDLSSRHYIDEDSDIPILGYQGQLSPEGLLSLAPDMIIGSDEMGPESTINALRNAGVAIETVSTGNHAADLVQRIDEIATITGLSSKTETLKKAVNQRFEALEQHKPETAPRVLFVMMSENRPMTVAGDQTPVNTVIKLAGGINPVEASFNSYKPMSIEAILEIQPEYIMLAERTWEAMGGIDGILEKNPLLAATPAGINQNFIPVRSAAIISGFGLQSLELTETLQAHLSSEPNL
ncbi:heme/hemin ABC transporter substrate-binding protein [Thaumasiovibrio sp. DFM-14]|uniref:heme/hemin ABC transporter substrate-binding protein n=1 Tax=Thaumasiovibrio sp. DFM-14 TaxID=3384792 RepID=UPI0039A30842